MSSKLFGNYERGSTGHTLNALIDHGVPVTTAESVEFGNNEIKLRGENFAHYKYFDGIEQPLFYFQNRIFGQQRFILEKDGSLRPKFHLSLSPNKTAAFVISGQEATQEMHSFLLGTLTNYIKDPWYKVHKDAGAFFQGGYGSPDGEWFFIEFWLPQGAQAYIDKLNEEYRPSKK